MRDYGIVRIRFWEWAKRQQLSAEERELALYLLTSPHGNSLGCFRLPMAYLCDDLGKDAAVVAAALSRLAAIGFLQRDEASGWTWIVGFLEHNPIPNRNVGKAVEKQIDAVPIDASFYGGMIDILQSLAGADDKGLSAAFLDRVSQRYRDRSDTASRRARTQNSESNSESTNTNTNTNMPKPRLRTPRRPGRRSIFASRSSMPGSSSWSLPANATAAHARWSASGARSMAKGRPWRRSGRRPGRSRRSR